MVSRHLTFKFSLNNSCTVGAYFLNFFEFFSNIPQTFSEISHKILPILYDIPSNFFSNFLVKFHQNVLYSLTVLPRFYQNSLQFFKNVPKTQSYFPEFFQNTSTISSNLSEIFCGSVLKKNFKEVLESIKYFRKISEHFILLL